MSDWFTDEELDRIARFAALPGHSRDPTMLLPEEVTSDATGDDDAATADERATDGETDGTDGSSEE